MSIIYVFNRINQVIDLIFTKSKIHLNDPEQVFATIAKDFLYIGLLPLFGS